MSLDTYRRKRNFSKTPEPSGGKSKDKKLLFVIQKHHARRLHYDLRLEHKGVLMSWAVPKGPSVNPDDKRLAVETEDHPYDYGFFEGTIPKGEYGAGTVEIWDTGTYKLLSDDMDASYAKGHLKVEFFGKVIKGIYNLARTKDKDWLLMKQKEERIFPEFPQKLTWDHKEIAITNLDKELFPGITKNDYMDYYGIVAEQMLPHIEGRPLTLVRFPDGINGEKFFQKDMSRNKPSWFKTYADSTEKKTSYGIVDDLPSFLYVANLVTEFHTWQSRIEDKGKPDKLVFDLDPSEPNLNLLRRCVENLKTFLEELGMPPYVMATGGKGYHVVVPIKPELTQEEVREFAEKIAKVFLTSDPDNLTLELIKEKRENKIFIDTNRNSPKQTSIAPYSIRAKENAPIAMPLTWKEFDVVDPNSYTLTNFPIRKDPWHDFFKKSISLRKIIKKLEK